MEIVSLLECGGVSTLRIGVTQHQHLLGYSGYLSITLSRCSVSRTHTYTVPVGLSSTGIICLVGDDNWCYCNNHNCWYSMSMQSFSSVPGKEESKPHPRSGPHLPFPAPTLRLGCLLYDGSIVRCCDGSFHQNH